ncbi:MAG: hypothetical protein ACE5IW_12295 [bacterium]
MSLNTFQQDIFNLLILGSFSENQVNIKWDPSLRMLPAALVAKIANYWNKEIVQTPKANYLFNGDLCRLNNWEVTQNRLNLHLGRTNYKELLYSNCFVQDIITRFGIEYLSKALGISAVLVSYDQNIVLIERSENVGEYPKRLDVLGGHIHPVDHAVSGVPNPFYAIKTELQEEVNLQVGPNEPVTCLGVIETRATKKPELVFLVKSQKTSDEILKCSVSRKTRELTRVFTIENRLNLLTSFLSNKKDQLSPSAYGSLWLYAQILKK